MTAVTINQRPSEPLAEENAVITLQDGYTYTTSLSKPITTQITWGSAAGGGTAIASPYATISGRTLTIVAKDVNGDAVTSGGTAYICVKGRL